MPANDFHGGKKTAQQPITIHENKRPKGYKQPGPAGVLSRTTGKVNLTLKSARNRYSHGEGEGNIMCSYSDNEVERDQKPRPSNAMLLAQKYPARKPQSIDEEARTT